MHTKTDRDVHMSEGEQSDEPIPKKGKPNVTFPSYPGNVPPDVFLYDYFTYGSAELDAPELNPSPSDDDYDSSKGIHANLIYCSELNTKRQVNDKVFFEGIEHHGLEYTPNAVSPALASELVQQVVGDLQGLHMGYASDRAKNSADFKWSENPSKKSQQQRHASLQYHVHGQGKYEYGGKVDTSKRILKFTDAHHRLLDSLRRSNILEPTSIEPEPDSLIVQVYFPGQLIPPHIDSTQYSYVIYAVSFGTPQELWIGPPGSISTPSPGKLIPLLDKSRPRSSAWEQKQVMSLKLLPLSCLKMKHFARYNMVHAIPPVTNWRISFTFRRYIGKIV